MNPYQDFVAQFVRLLHEGKTYPLGGFAPAPRPALPKHAPKVLIFSPHPDDECIIGALPFRLLREARLRVLNVAVTQGSRKDRQAERYQELERACQYMGFGLIQTKPNGLEKISVKTREQDPAAWSGAVRIIAQILSDQQPQAIFFPHDQDWNSTHIGTHFLVMDALAALGPGFQCFAFETEFWGPMWSPNLMVESSADDVAEMVTGITFHAGEVRRNPYHLLLPAWMEDNVRRGCELVGGQGGAAPDFVFATLYRLRKWTQGRLLPVLTGGKNLSCRDKPASLFG